jgi:DNA-binding CsgD family transcriptional regulator
VTLTPREREVGLMVMDGKQAKEIAAALDIATNTVKMHIYLLYRKLGINKRTQLKGKIQ